MLEIKTALITGASGGIGLEFAKLFAADGYNLILIARSKEKLEAIATELYKKHKTATTIIAKDLSNPLAPREVFKELQEKNCKVSVLINNAGFGDQTFFAEADLKKTLRMIQLNITTLTHLTRLFLPEMIKRKSGKILNVASTAAYLPGPYMAVYYASKAYVLSFSQALSSELASTGVTATVLCPGPTETGFKDTANLGNSNLFKRNLMNAETVAKLGYNALIKEKPTIVTGFSNTLMTFITRFLPRQITAETAKKLQKPN
ncbi:MAG: SDR family oxidoreductase [bacterium]